MEESGPPARCFLNLFIDCCTSSSVIEEVLYVVLRGANGFAGSTGLGSVGGCHWLFARYSAAACARSGIGTCRFSVLQRWYGAGA